MTELLKRATENSNMDEKEEAFLRENIRKGNNKRGGKENLCSDIWFDFTSLPRLDFSVYEKTSNETYNHKNIR